MAADKLPRLVNCPTCGKPVPWVAESRYRPFCSERCRRIDLGAWAAEEYRVASREGRTEPDEQATPGEG
jgi:hypothetical protein